MPSREQPRALGQYRLAGEDAPPAMITVFALVGTLMAMAAMWLWLDAGPREAQPIPAGAPLTEPVQAPLPPDAVAPGSALPAPQASNATAETASVATEGEVQERPLMESDSNDKVPPAAEAEDPHAARLMPLPAGPDVAQTTPAGEDCPPVLAVRFMKNSDRPIVKEVETEIAALVKWLDAHPQARLSVEGHADSSGADQMNLLLSYRRAKATAALLVQAGVAPQHIVIRAAGEEQPLDGFPTDSALNRRASVAFEGCESR